MGITVRPARRRTSRNCESPDSRTRRRPRSCFPRPWAGPAGERPRRSFGAVGSAYRPPRPQIRPASRLWDRLQKSGHRHSQGRRYTPYCGSPGDAVPHKRKQGRADGYDTSLASTPTRHVAYGLQAAATTGMLADIVRGRCVPLRDRLGRVSAEGEAGHRRARHRGAGQGHIGIRHQPRSILSDRGSQFYGMHRVRKRRARECSKFEKHAGGDWAYGTYLARVAQSRQTNGKLELRARRDTAQAASVL